jgi:hypothetical protein
MNYKTKLLSKKKSTAAAVVRVAPRWRSSIILAGAALLAVVVVLVAFAVHKGWQTATANQIECQTGFQPLPYASNGYIEFFLEKQELAEPLFDGSYFIDLTQEYGKGPMRLKVTTSGARSYGSSISVADMSWNESIQELRMNDKVRMDFVSQSGSHRNFPFDSARFDFALRTDPLVNIPVFRFNNRVSGFYMPCDDVKVTRSEDGSFRVSFGVKRDLLTRVAAVLLFGAAVIFAFAITMPADGKALPAALASYFFSLWSIRGVFGLGAEGFPTLLDVGILTLCMLILILLFSRILIRAYRRGQPSVTHGPSPQSTR